MTKKKRVVKTKIKIPRKQLNEKIEKLGEWIAEKYPAVSNQVAVALRVKFRAGLVIKWDGATSIENVWTIGHNALFNIMRDWGVLLEDVPELQSKRFVKFYKKKAELAQKHLMIDIQSSVKRNAKVIKNDNPHEKDKEKQNDKAPS